MTFKDLYGDRFLRRSSRYRYFVEGISRRIYRALPGRARARARRRIDW